MPGYFEQLEERLMSLNLVIDNKDVALANICLDRAESAIQHTCNLPAVPAELESILVDMSAGEYLQTQKAVGKLTGIDGTDVKINDAAVSGVSMGDTNVSYASGTVKSPEQRLDALITHLTRDRKKELLKYRRISW